MTAIPVGNYALSGDITTATGDFSVKFSKDGKFAISVDFQPSQLGATLVNFQADGTTVDKTIESAGPPFVNLSKFYIFIYGDIMSVLLSDPNPAIFEILTVQCKGLIDELDSVTQPSTTIVATQTSYLLPAQFEADFGSGLSTAFTAYWNLTNDGNDIENGLVPIATSLCPEAEPFFMSTTAWIVTGVLIGVAVIFIILFGLSAGNVIKPPTDTGSTASISDAATKTTFY